MAFVARQDEDDDELQTSAAPTAAQSAMIGGSGGVGAANAKTPDKSGNFVGISDYLNANKAQSGALGDKVSGRIQDSVGQAQSAIGGLQQGFQQRAKAGQIEGFDTAETEAKGITDQAAGRQATGGGFAQGSPETANRFKTIANATYAGPKTIADTDLYQPAQQKIMEAQKLADTAKDEAGQQSLLADINKTPGYTSGAQRLDSYLLKSGDNRQKIANARQSAGTLGGAYSDAREKTADYAALQQQLAEGLQKSTRGYTNQVQGKRNQDVSEGLANQGTHWNDDYNRILGLLQNSNGGKNFKPTSSADAAKLGVDYGEHIFNMLDGSVDPRAYLSQQAFDANKVIGRDEQAQLSALDELAGMYGGKNMNQYTQQGLAGTLNRDQALDASAFGRKQDELQANFDADAATRRFVDPNSNQSVAEYINNFNRYQAPEDRQWFSELAPSITAWLESQGYGNKVRSEKDELLHQHDPPPLPEIIGREVNPGQYIGGKIPLPGEMPYGVGYKEPYVPQVLSPTKKFIDDGLTKEQRRYSGK